MINLGLSAADKRAYHRALRSSHRIRVRARIHNRDEKIIHTFRGSILSGSVQVDATQSPASTWVFARGEDRGSGPVRTLDITILLPRKDQAWLPDAPGSESAFADNFISVLYGVWVEDLSGGADWVDVPVFWGPITGLSRDGDQVNIRGEGKEVLAMDPVLLWTPLTLRKGSKRTVAIRRVLGAVGEKRFSIPRFNQRLKNTWSLHRHKQAWFVASTIAKWGDWQLYYDGRGRVRARRYPQNRVWLFKSGDNGTLLSKPNITYDVSATRNLVELMGTVPRGKDKTRKVRVVARPGGHHPLSPWKLRRNGVMRHMVHSEDDVESQNKAEMQRRANRLLADLVDVQNQVQFDTLVIPHLEEGDRVGVLVGGNTYATGPARELEGVHIEFRLQKFTIPLTAGESMSIGLNRRVSWKRRGSLRNYRWTR